VSWLALHAIELVHILDAGSFGTAAPSPQPSPPTLSGEREPSGAEGPDLSSLASTLAVPTVDSSMDSDFLALIGRAPSDHGSHEKLRALCIALYDPHERQSASFAATEQAT
jgi:hypothetical protein